MNAKKTKCSLLLILTIVLTLCCLFMASCGDEDETKDWHKDFQVKCTHIEGSKYASEAEELNAILNHTKIYEHDRYEITNTANNVMERVYLIFYTDFIGLEPCEFKVYMGTVKQGETKVQEMSESYIAISMGYSVFPDEAFFDFDKCKLTKIEYELKD